MRVLVALEPSKITYEAIEFYFTKLYKPDHNIFVFHLARPVGMGMIPKGMAGNTGASIKGTTRRQSVVEIEETLKEKAEAVAEQFNVPKKKFHYSVREIENSNSAEELGREICTECEFKKIDMVVMGCRNTKQKKFLGSVSDYIVRHADAVCMVAKV